MCCFCTNYEVIELDNQICCIWGHRRINETSALRAQLSAAIECLIVEKGVNTFLFGSKSRFNDLCYELITEIKSRYPHIQRIYVRAEFPIINESYRSYLLERYEDTYFPEKLLRAGKAVYVRRNFEMIDKSHYCLIYYDASYTPIKRKSGTKLAIDYAMKKKTEIILFPG